MKTLFAFLLGLFLVVASLANAATPSVNVTVSDASGKLAFKGATKNDGGFATGKLQAGNYVVQFNSKNAALKGGQYSIVVAAGQKKVVANPVAGEKFLGAGVAMKVAVGAGLSVTGQVSTATKETAADNSTPNRDTMRKTTQDRPQEMYRPPMSQSLDKMPGR